MTEVAIEQKREDHEVQTESKSLSPKEFSELSERAKSLYDRIEATRQELIQCRDIHDISVEDIAPIADILQRLDALHQETNGAIEVLNNILPDDCLESGRSVYGKISSFQINTKAIIEATGELKDIISEKKAVVIKKQLKADQMKELQTDLSKDAVELEKILHSLVQSIEATDGKLSGVAGLWSRMRGQTMNLANQRSMCSSVAGSLRDFLEENKEDGSFSVRYTSQVDKIVSVFQDVENQTALQAAHIDVDTVVSLLERVKESVNKKTALSNESYGVDSSKISSMRQEFSTLMAKHRLVYSAREYPKETVDSWYHVAKVHEALGVDEKHEPPESKDVTVVSTTPDAILLGKKRSNKNMRESIFLYAQTRFKAGLSPEAVITELRQEAERVQETMKLGYNETAEGIEKILESGRIINLFEHSTVEQRARKKSWSDTEEILQRRKMIDTKLGWDENEKVYHLAIDDVTNDATNGSANEYGSVRLQFAYSTFADQSTFTESDSLNPKGLPPALEFKRDFSSNTRGVIDRQIAAEHVPYAKAMFNLLEKQAPTADGREMRYIEAQIGGIDGKDLIDKLEGVVIDVKEFKSEAEFSHLDETETIEKIRKFCEQRSIPLRFINTQAA